MKADTLLNFISFFKRKFLGEIIRFSINPHGKYYCSKALPLPIGACFPYYHCFIFMNTLQQQNYQK